MQYISLEFLLDAHDFLLNEYWWKHWEHNLNAVDSVLTHIQNNEYYPNFTDKSVQLFYCIIKFHPFIDWNKRTAITALLSFWTINWKILLFE
jgi:death-on-curing protein